LLRRALDSLLTQSLRPAEILVVDNAPPDACTQSLIIESFPNVRYVCEREPGLNFARNRALRETTREIVAYMDDDAIADTDWIARTSEVFAENGRIAICTGCVKAYSLETEAQRLFEAQGGFDRGAERIHMPRDARHRRMHGLNAPLIAWSIAIGVGASIAVRRSALGMIGNFDNALDFGAVCPGGGDVDVIWRTLEAGFEVVYEPRVIVFHEHRRELEQVYAQILGHRRGEIAFLTKSLWSAQRGRQLVIFAFLSWRLLKPGFRLLRLAFRDDPLPAPVLWRLWGAHWRGLLSYGQASRLAAERSAGTGA
jgi:glycosyltransferase involved in cell wall biosynthesis